MFQTEHIVLVQLDQEEALVTADQLRAARALLGLSQGKLAERTGLSSMTIKRAEGAGKPPPSGATIETIRSVLESAGVEFIPENGGGAGVRLRNER